MDKEIRIMTFEFFTLRSSLFIYNYEILFNK